MRSRYERHSRCSWTCPTIRLALRFRCVFSVFLNTHAPLLLAPPYKKLMIVTEGGQTVTLDDTPGIGGITLETSSGQKIVMNATGIEIDNGMGAKISMTGPQVSVNNGALDIL